MKGDFFKETVTSPSSLAVAFATEIDLSEMNAHSTHYDTYTTDSGPNGQLDDGGSKDED